jgi:hypothetical protein
MGKSLYRIFWDCLFKIFTLSKEEKKLFKKLKGLLKNTPDNNWMKKAMVSDKEHQEVYHWTMEDVEKLKQSNLKTQSRPPFLKRK